MPKRLIDGERLWGSDKLRLVVPEKFRAEYSNMIPLALADGSFECDAYRVWSQVYAYNRSDVDVEAVESILTELERVKLLFRWTARDGKKWGFWVGIDSEGLLPSDGHKKRYKLGKTPPQDRLKSFVNADIEGIPENTETPGHIRIDSGPYPAGLAVGLVSSSISISSEESEANVSFKNNISDKSLEILGVRIFPQDAGWADMASYARVKGQSETRDAFETWAKERQGDEIRYPLTDFLRVAEQYFDKKFSSSVDVKPLILELSYLSDGRVTFNQKQSVEIARLLETCSDADIKSAFKEFLDNLDENSVKYAGKDFSEKAEQIIYTQRKRKQQTEQTAAQLENVIASERHKAEAELAKLPEEFDPATKIEL